MKILECFAFLSFIFSALHSFKLTIRNFIGRKFDTQINFVWFSLIYKSYCFEFILKLSFGIFTWLFMVDIIFMSMFNHLLASCNQFFPQLSPRTMIAEIYIHYCPINQAWQTLCRYIYTPYHLPYSCIIRCDVCWKCFEGVWFSIFNNLM